MRVVTARALVRPMVVAVTPAVRLLLGMFYDRRLMSGIHFDGSLVGYRRMFTALWKQKILGFNRRCPWPLAPSSIVSDYSRIHFDPDDLANFMSPGCYFQNFSADIYIGAGTLIAPNVGIITANHMIGSLGEHAPGENVVIGEGCWLGMNSVILPGVVLGPRTIVGAGSVVTKSFESGDCVIAGNPARILRTNVN